MLTRLFRRTKPAPQETPEPKAPPPRPLFPEQPPAAAASLAARLPEPITELPPPELPDLPPLAVEPAPQEERQPDQPADADVEEVPPPVVTLADPPAAPAAALTEVAVVAVPPFAQVVQPPIPVPASPAAPPAPAAIPADLAQRLAESFPFDEAWYLATNRDVAEAVATGRCLSGRFHFVMYGRAEGRQPVPPSHGGGAVAPEFRPHHGPGFLVPTDLRASEILPRRIALFGAGLAEEWGFHRRNPAACPVDAMFSAEPAPIPDILVPGTPPADYDLQIVQIPLRAVVHDTLQPAPGHEMAPEAAFDAACERLALNLQTRMEWSEKHGILTLVANFLTPQRNPLGLLARRYDPRNPEYLVARLNERLEEMVRAYPNAYVLDIDRIAASLGRRYIQDDSLNHGSAGSVLPPIGVIAERAEPMAPVASHYEMRWHPEFVDGVWAEAMAMFRAARRVDPVRLVAIDLDDTMWAGVTEERADEWPLGIAEALTWLRRRGVRIAIVSQSEETRLRTAWTRVFGDRLDLNDLADIRIDGSLTPDNMRALLDAVRFEPSQVVFADADPGRRAAMAAAFPGLRVLGSHPYYLRRVLLWAAETEGG